VPVREPEWWYAAASDWRAQAMRPAATVWAWAAMRRQQRAVPQRSGLPVICIGNFTAGGTGKTPLSIHVARALMAAGERPVFLTRGYGGRIAGPHRVVGSIDTARDVGDEPLLLAREAPVIVSRDRVAGAKLAAADSGLAPPTVIVMDDGLQNPGLAKDLSIAVVDGVRAFGNGAVIPAGPLRAPLEMQFGLADAIVVNAAPGADLEVVHCTAELLRARFHGPVLEAGVVADAEGAGLAGTRVLAFAGIANPDRFYALIEGLGGEIVERVTFADHHPFSEEDAQRVLGLAAQFGLRLITTEKDLVRLAGESGARAQLREAAVAVPIRLRLEPRDELRLASLVEAALMKSRKPAAMS
jgi:tetraacyldisaccharide 4'-kinase